MQTGLAFSYLIKHVDPFDTDITSVPPSEPLKARRVWPCLALTRNQIKVFRPLLTSARGHRGALSGRDSLSVVFVSVARAGAAQFKIRLHAAEPEKQIG